MCLFGLGEEGILGDEASVKNLDEVLDLLILVAAKAGRGNCVRQGDAVERVLIVELSDGEHRGEHAVGVSAVLGVGAGAERRALAVAGREAARGLAVDDVRRDRQDGLRRNCPFYTSDAADDKAPLVLLS